MSSRIIRIPASSPDSQEASSAAVLSDELPRIERFRFRPAGYTADSQPPVVAEESQHTNPSLTAASSLASLDPGSVQEQCERLLQETRLKVSQIEKEAYEKGFAEGRKAVQELVHQRIAASPP